jgi:hypothetical protein
MRFIRTIPFKSVKPDMGYHPNLILMACKTSPNDVRFMEFPISWGKVETSNVNVFQYGLIHLGRLIKIGFGRLNKDKDYGRDLNSKLVFPKS